MDAMELKHEQAIGKSNSKFKKQMVFCLNNSSDILIHVFQSKFLYVTEVRKCELRKTVCKFEPDFPLN